MRYQCPVDGCYESFESPQSLCSHVAGKAQSSEDHRLMRDSPEHEWQWYEKHCKMEGDGTPTQLADY
jgi:hypothetical protein